MSTTKPMSQRPGKRSACDAEMDEEFQPKKKACPPSLLPGEEPTGHYCPLCMDMIHVSEVVNMFMGCGHIFHHGCTSLTKMKTCPLCRLDASADINPLHCIMLRLANYLSALSTPQRVRLLQRRQEDRAALAKLTLTDFYSTVNSVVYGNVLPKTCVVNVAMGRYMWDDFICTRNNDDVTVHIFVKAKDTHIQNQWELFRVMWHMYTRSHSITETMFINLTTFEDFYMF